jgi:hypothetical protein
MPKLKSSLFVIEIESSQVLWSYINWIQLATFQNWIQNITLVENLLRWISHLCPVYTIGWELSKTFSKYNNDSSMRYVDSDIFEILS